MQTSLSSWKLDTAESAATAEVDPGLLPLLLEEETTLSLRARGSTAPVNEPATARLLSRKVPERVTTNSLAQAGVQGSTGQVGIECSLAALSQRREFLGTGASEAGSVAPREGLWVSTSRGQKGRQVVGDDGLVGRCLRPVAVKRSPHPGTRGTAGISDELMCMGPVGMVSERFPIQAARRYHQRGRRGRRRRHKKEGRGHSRDIGRGDVARVEWAGSRPSLQGPSGMDTDTESRGEEAKCAAAGTPAASDWNGVVSVSGEIMSGEMKRESSPLTAVSSAASKLGLVERWKRREVKPASLAGGPAGTGVGFGEDAGATVTGDDEDALGAVSGPSLRADKGVEPSELMSVPDSVETWLTGSGRRVPLEVSRADWSMMQDLGLGSHPDLVAALAWRRCTGPSLARGGHTQLPTVNLVSHDALDIPKDSWPTTWEGLVEHVEKGGYFRTVAAMRGGMDPAEAQRLLSIANFDGHTRWDEIDRNLARVRAGEQISPAEMTDPMCLAQALAGCVALQQWDSLAAFLGTLPQEVMAGLILTPARLAALSVIAARPRQEPKPPPQWLLSASFAELRFNHLSPSDFVPDPHRANDLRGQIQDGIVNRLLSMAPDIKHHRHFRLQDLRSDLRVELNLKDLQVESCLFSATVVLPTGPWISDFYKGVKSLGGRSFCTIVPTDLHVETELSNTDQQVIRAIRNALGVDNATFRLILDESLSAALLCDARSRDDTARFTSNGGKGGKRTMEHVPPDSPDSRLLVSMDGTSLILARRTVTRLPLRLGPVTIGLTLPQCPQQALRSVLQPREPAAIRLRAQGTVIDCPIILLGPLPKGSLPARILHSGARMAELRRHMHDVCQAELHTNDVRLVGRYDKDRSPMFLYMEFGSADAAQYFGSVVDQQAPPEFAKLLVSLCGDKAYQMQVWSCNLLAESLAAADEKTLKALMSHGQNHPCQLPPPPPPAPQAPGHGAGQVANGTGSAAGGPDNPANGQH